MHYVTAKAILASKNQMNIYKGCSCGCIYCDARTKNQGGYAFEDIEVKENALELLEEQLKKKKHCMINIGSQYDPYQDVERKLMLTRKSLELIDKYEFGVSIMTKSNLILRDLDIIESINKKKKAVVIIPISTFNDSVCRLVEPNASFTKERIEVLMECKKRGIPTVVNFEPVLPFITDNRKNIYGILEACSKASVYGVVCNGMGMTLRDSNRNYYYKKLDELFHGTKEKYQMVYQNKDEALSLQHSDLMNYFNAVALEFNIETDNDKINDFIYTLEETQLSIFDFM